MELTGFVGWRGMVGSVLLDRMQAERDFDLIEPIFFSTSNAGGAAPSVARNETRLHDAYDIDQLKRCSIVVTTRALLAAAIPLPQTRRIAARFGNGRSQRAISVRSASALSTL